MLVFTLNMCANKDIHLHQYETHVFDFGPSCCCKSQVYGNFLITYVSIMIS